MTIGAKDLETELVLGERYVQFMDLARLYEQRGDRSAFNDQNPVEKYRTAFRLYRRAFNLDPMRHQEALIYGLSVLERLYDYHKKVEDEDGLKNIKSLRAMVNQVCNNYFGIDSRPKGTGCDNVQQSSL